MLLTKSQKMKKILLTICFAFSINLNAQTSGNGVTDIDGNFYPTVIIGTQEWTTVNLRVTHYKNGDIITNAQNGSNLQWSNLTTPARCQYIENQSTYYTLNEDGLLYNWFAVNDSRNIAPEGWHIPTKAEWETLIANSLSSTNDVMRKINDGGSDPLLKYWKLSCSSTQNPWNFSALASGGRFIDQTANTGYYGFGPGYTFPVGGQPTNNARTRAYFWSSTSSTSLNNSWCAKIITCVEPPFSNPNPNNLLLETQSQKSGFSIRVIKNTNLNNEIYNKSKFSIYPNPVKTELTINISEKINLIEIFDLLGKNVFYKENPSKTINIEFLEKGIYILKIKTDNENYCDKIIKK